jgi:hypothetical protein
MANKGSIATHISSVVATKKAGHDYDLIKTEKGNLIAYGNDVELPCKAPKIACKGKCKACRLKENIHLTDKTKP